MKLKYQLFVILLVASATLIAALFAFNSWNFNRGFVNYLNRSQTEVLKVMAADLAEDYAIQGSWDWLSNDPDLWRRMAKDTWRDSLQLAKQPPPPPGKKPPPAGKAPDGRNRPERRPPLILADANKKVLLGRFKSDTPIAWIAIGESESPVGFLGYRTADRLPRQVDSVFAKQQGKNFAIASLLMVALSALLAALLASRIVKPVVQVSQAVAEIRRGDYAHRVTRKRRDELGDLSRDVNQLASTLEQSRTARRKWIAEISHELRTPLAILQGEVEAIADGIRPFDATSLESLHSETRRLSRLVDDLHDLSLSDLGALNYQMAPMDLSSLLKERLGTVKKQCDEKELDVELQCSEAHYLVLGDHQRIGQLLDNLLQNSIRYTNTGGRIVIALSQSAENVTIRWQDSAPGVSTQDLPRLFDPLYRAEQSRNRSLGGAGLGLAIARKIVTAHQGSLSAEHSELGGLQIDLQLPTAHTTMDTTSA